MYSLANSCLIIQSAIKMYLPRAALHIPNHVLFQFAIVIISYIGTLPYCVIYHFRISHCWHRVLQTCWRLVIHHLDFLFMTVCVTLRSHQKPSIFKGEKPNFAANGIIRAELWWFCVCRCNYKSVNWSIGYTFIHKIRSIAIILVGHWIPYVIANRGSIFIFHFHFHRRYLLFS